jgi:DNA-binding MarR family transcriptional regulator
MSTRLTQKGTPMVDSLALKLVQTASQVQERTSYYLSESLLKKGYEGVTPSVLNFLSTLECGVNYGSEIARNLKVSRQMVAKTVKELSLRGYLEQVEDIGKQKKILFTKKGELLMSDARQLLADIDLLLLNQLSEKSLKDTLNTLQYIQEILIENTK